VMLFAGGAGTLFLGPLADRVGRRAVLAGTMLLLSPLIYAFAFSGPLSGMVLLAFVGAATIGTFGVTVVMGQEYLPGRIGTAAGVTLGFSIGLGGVGAPLFGAIADNYGLPTMMLTLGALPIAGLALALTLPRQPGFSSRSGA
jgi:MFS transporter, FSR family, fosmidomycin resistance protein